MALQKVKDTMRTTTALDGSKLSNDSITLAHMASGTDGQVITYSAAGDPVAIGPGTAGEVLTSAGANLPQTFAEAGGGAWNVIGTSVADGSTGSLIVQGITSAYHQYAICFSGLRFSGNASGALLMRFGDAGGIHSAAGDYAQIQTSSEANLWNGTTGYQNKIIASGSSGGGSARGAGGQNHIQLTSSSGGADNPVTGGIHPTNGMFYLTTQGGVVGCSNTLIGMMSTGKPTTWEMKGHSVFGWKDPPIALTQVQIYPDSSEKFNSGRMTIWGIAHA